MASQKLNPAQRAAGRAREYVAWEANVPDHNPALAHFQMIGDAATTVVSDLRIAWLRHRFHIGPSMAEAIASLHFGEEGP